MSAARVALIAVDPSDHSKRAFEWYMENMYRPDDAIVICHIPEIPDLCALSFKRFMENMYRQGDNIVICHIPESPHLHSLSFRGGLKLPVEDWQNSLTELNEKTKKLLDDYEFLLRNKNIHNFKCVGEHHSKPGRGIIEAAESNKADMIVVGTRGLDAMGRAFRGSVSDSVVHHSRVPVIICPNQGQ